MNRRHLPQLVRVIALVALALPVVIGAATIKPVHPASLTAGLSAPLFIAVLADNYAAGQEQAFDLDVENFFKHGLLVDDYYKNRAADIRIVSYFEPTPAGQTSLYDFQINPGVGNCAVTSGADTTTKINQVLTGVNPFHVIVIGNHKYNFGCTDGAWTYIAVDAVATDVLQHEMGHVIAELFDEWVMPANQTVAYPGVIQTTDTRNCWPSATTPHWMTPKFPGAQAKPGCALFGQGVVHPYDFCRMGTATHHPQFCEVCKAEMDANFEYFKNVATLIRRGANQLVSPLPPGPQASHEPTNRSGLRIVNAAFAEQQPVPAPALANTPRPVMRVVASFNPDSNVLTYKSRTFSNGIYIPNYRRLGQFLYEIQVNNNTVEVGVLPDHLFQARGYRSGAPHGTSAPKATDVIITIPDENEKTIAGRQFKIVMYKVPTTVAQRIITVPQFQEFMKNNALPKVAEMTLP